MNDDLQGVHVLVHPDLPHDPAKKQNEIGLIKLANPFCDEFLVRFPDGKEGLYAADALLILKPQSEIHQFLNDNAYELSFPDLKVLTQIDLLLHYGSDLKALTLARNNPPIQDICLHTLDNAISLNQSYER